MCATIVKTILQVYASENPPTVESIGRILGTIGGGFPLDTWFDLTYLNEGLGEYLPARWVTILDESKEPITLAEIRVYGSEYKFQKLDWRTH